MKKRVVSPQLEFFMLLVSTKNRFLRHFEGLVHDVTFNEFLILYYLDHSLERKSTQVSLARRMGMTPPGVMRIIEKMEQKGLITKKNDPRNRRSLPIYLTKIGSQKFLEVLEEAEEIAKELQLQSSPILIRKYNTALRMISSNTLF